MHLPRWFARAALTLLVSLAVVPQAGAQFTYVGSWNTMDGPAWGSAPPEGPLAYTGREAAALLFGGSANDYVISTAGTDASSINYSAWYSVIGAGAWEFSDDYFNKYLGQYYGPTSGFGCCGADYRYTNAASAYVQDNGGGVNYAFRVDAVTATPEPASILLVATGLAGVIGVSRRRKTLLAD